MPAVASPCVFLLSAWAAFTAPLKRSMICFTMCVLFVSGRSVVILTSGGAATLVVAWAPAGVGWTEPGLSVATLWKQKP